MNLKRLSKKTIVTAGLLAGCASAATASTITIYKDFASIQDELSLNLQTGSNDLTHYDITRQVEPSSVMLTPKSPGWRIIVAEQNYLANPLDQDRLLAQYEGQTIDFQVTYGDHTSIRKGLIVRAMKPGAHHTAAQDAIIEMEGQLQFGLPGKPLFPPLPDHQMLKPQLSWKLNANKSGKALADLSYLTTGFGWEAAYNFIQTSKRELTGAGWLTIDNHSGKDFQQSKLKLVAGDVNKITQQAYQPKRRIVASAMADEQMSVAQKAVDAFHMYTVPGKLDLRSGESKQVQFLSGQNIRYHTDYIYDGANLPYGYRSEYIRTQREFGTQSKNDVVISKVIENTASNGLGKPFPEGTIRFYEKDDGGSLIFIGENRVKHTPKDETLRITTGNAFDLKGERKQTAFSVNKSGRTATETIRITLTNRKMEPTVIKVVEHLYRGPNYTINNMADWVKEDATTMYQSVEVAANTQQVIQYTVNYRW